MTNFQAYLDSKDLLQLDAVNALSPTFTGFTESIASIINRPMKYGVQMAPEAESILVQKFGPGPGLSISVDKKKNHGNKNKPNRLTLRVDDNLRSRLEALYKGMSFAYMQDLLEAAILEFVEKHEVKA